MLEESFEVVVSRERELIAEQQLHGVPVPIKQVFAFGPPVLTGTHGSYRCRSFWRPSAIVICFIRSGCAGAQSGSQHVHRLEPLVTVPA